MEWQPSPIFLPGEFHGQRSLAGYSPWGHKEVDTTEWPTLSFSLEEPRKAECWQLLKVVDGDIRIYYTIFSTWCLKIFIVKVGKKMINTFLVTLSVKLPSTTLFIIETLSPCLYPSLPFLLCFLHSTHHHWMYYLLPYFFSSLSVCLHKTVSSIKAGIFVYFVLCCISGILA